MTDYSLIVQNISKSFSGFHLDNISFSLPKGYIMGLVGTNGAGKTTTIKLILNMMEKNCGDISVFGLDAIKNERQIKQKLAVVFDTNIFVDEWTITETERAISPFYDEWNHRTFTEMLEKFQLSPKMKVGKLSRGMQMRLMLACAFSHNAQLLILDEPTSGLDPLARDELMELLQDYIKDGERSVLFSTHITSDLQKVADYITFLKHGKLVFTGSMDDLLKKYVFIKGAPEELNVELKKHIIGLRQTNMGFEGLISSALAKQYKGYVFDKPTIDDIVIFISKDGEK